MKRSKVYEKIKEVFPNAIGHHILNGSYGWLRLTGKTDKYWEDQIYKYTLFYQDTYDIFVSGFNVIGDVNKLTNHPIKGDNLLKSIDKGLREFNII